jgi:hypothetical protein
MTAFSLAPEVRVASLPPQRVTHAKLLDSSAVRQLPRDINLLPATVASPIS